MTNTIPNVPRELLGRASNLAFQTQHYPLHEELRTLLSAQSPADHVEDVRAMVAAPSPAGVDGLEVVGYFFQHEETGNVMSVDAQQVDWGFEANNPRLHRVCALADYDKAQAIIDGLRGEVAGLRKRAKTAEREAGSALRTYKGLEKVARVVSDNSDQVCGELNVLRQQFDQQAQRIGELEGLLQEVHGWIDESARVYRHNSTSVMLYRIDAALSAGKEGE